MDIFIEQIVSKKPDTRDKFLKVFMLSVTGALISFCGAVFYVFMMLPFISFVALAAIPGIIWVANYSLKSTHTEYDYILTNKDLDFDKITGRSKRKRMISLNLANAEKLDVFGEDASPCGADTTVAAHDNSFVNIWYLIVKDDKHGRVVVLFNPNDRFIVKLNKMLPARARNRKVDEIAAKSD
jgi:hypothetical protein